MHHDLRMVSVASKDDSESAADTASDRTTPLCIASLIKGRVCEAQPYTRLHWNGPSLIG